MSEPRYTPRLLAEAVRARLSPSPSDELPGLPLGTLAVERAWLPVFRLEDQTATVVTVLSGDDSGETMDRRLLRQVDVDVDISVQRLLSPEVAVNSAAGKAEIDAIADFGERILREAYASITDAEGRRYTPLKFERTLVDDALREWHQVSLLFAITYRTHV